MGVRTPKTLDFLHPKKTYPHTREENSDAQLIINETEYHFIQLPCNNIAEKDRIKMDESLDPRIKTLFHHPVQGREGEGEEESSSRKSGCGVYPADMKVLLKKWYGIPKKDRGSIAMEDEEGREEISGGSFHPRPAPSSSCTSSSIYDIPKKRRRFLDNSNMVDNHHLYHQQSRLSSALIPVYSSPPGADNEEELEEGKKKSPQNLVMESHRKSHARESEDIQNNNSSKNPSKQIKEEEQEGDDGIRDGICSWCLHTLDQPRSSQFTMSILDDPTSNKNKYFAQSDASLSIEEPHLKRTNIYQTSFEDKLIFCSESCLKTYKFEETSRPQSKAIPHQHKKSNKQSRRLQEKSHSQTPIVKIKPDIALKSNENSRKKQQNPRVDQIPPPSSSTNAPHTFHMIPPPSTLRQGHPPFLGMLPEPTNSQPLLPLAALAGALAAASSSARPVIPSVSVPQPSRPSAFQHPPSHPQLLGSSSFPSPITLCPTPFFVPFPIPIPLLIPVPEKSFKGSSFFFSGSESNLNEQSPGTKNLPSIKTEYSTLECDNEERRRRKRASSSLVYISDHPNPAHSLNFAPSYERK
ncbi:unnamed protein product [Lepeophtheirus salmonis]|uniref:(salmon louse) hypothetical protein n=1 Tax=Lepeophtheirus salmonis TaxID=72036 RepID=A0A7R8CRP2_LEPSM|nr:unnamed protein product [Lepeophtheirus salmonis]CAF2907238.1 unnamed protein product [Lepeophtheirus salmonis]